MVTRSYRHLDDRDVGVLAGLMLPDGMGHRQGVALPGAEVTAHMLVVRHEPGRPLDGPAPLDGIENVRTARATRRRACASLRCGATRPASRNKNQTEDMPCVG